MSEELERQGMDPVEDAEEENTLPGRGLFEWLQTILGCVLTAVIVFNCFACLSRVDGHSMDPTLEDGELMLVWMLGYQPKHGDIVVLHKTIASGHLDAAIVKRVIATEGQTVDIDYVEGVVYVDGEPLEEDYILEEMWLPSSEKARGTHFEVPEGEIFVLGDNRNGSSDSRHTGLGTVDTDYVIGRAVAAIWPMDKFGLL